MYGIDLASPSELVAHNRNADEIARHISADSVIYQTLPDLEAACREESIENGGTSPTTFEVGVFNGKYVTPVPPEYLEHVERIRGEGRKCKVVDAARNAVVNGVASTEELRLATGGAKVTQEGNVLPVLPSEVATGEATRAHDERGKDRMDISLHNIGDYP